jgi:hypothetical protein
MFLSGLILTTVLAGTGLMMAATGDTMPGGIVAGVSYGTPPAAGSATQHQCTWMLSTPRDSATGPAETVSKLVDGVRYWLYDRLCEDRFDLVWVPEVSPANLATFAASEARRMVPAPTLHTAPPLDRGVVHVPMWFWTSAQVWQTIEATAWVPTENGVLWATARATPQSLVFDSGGSADGSGLTTCVGPGSPWQTHDGDTAYSPCSVTYRRASSTSIGDQFPAALHIIWATSWTSSSGLGGTLEPLVSSTFAPVTVQEIHALLSR